MSRPLLLLLLGACGPAADAPAEGCVSCDLTDAESFSYTATLEVASFSIPERTDLVVRWDALDHDLRGGDLDPVEEARLLAFRDLSPDEVVAGLTADAIDQADVALFVTCSPTDSRCALSEFGVLGNALDVQQYIEAGAATWLLALGAPASLQVEALAFLAPAPEATASEVAITDATSHLEVWADLHSAAELPVAAHTPSLRLDWSHLAHDGRGALLDTATVDELWVGRFDASPEALEEDFFALEERADARWSMPVDGASAADLSELAGDTPFEGVDPDHTWLAALRCRTCTNPAPRALVVLRAVTP